MAKTNSPIGYTLSYTYEVVFCIFLVVLAFLVRDNNALIYPQILYLFVLLLGLNLAAGYTLRHWPSRRVMATAIILANCATITWILRYSGEQDSNLWVLYLLPLYTVSMLLGRAEVIWVTTGVLSFNLVFYVTSTTTWDGSILFSLLLKSGLFVFAAGATHRLADRHRQARERIDTQRQDLESLSEKVEQQEVDLANVSRMVDIAEMTSGVAHDLNNPITVIVGSAKLLLEEGSLLPVAFRPDIERIERAAQLCQTISTNLLHFARDNKFQLTPLNANDVVKSTLTIYQKTLEQDGIIVQTDLQPDIPLVEASASHLERVLLNLFSNARSSMRNGGLLRIRTQSQAPRSEGRIGWVQLTVDDSGAGLSPEAMIHLFKPFHTTKGSEGTGLGLYLCREIVKRHNGTLTAENCPQGGARFVVSLPAIAQELAA